MKKIVIFMFSISGGGAERTIVNIINNIDRSKYDITLLLGSRKRNDYIDFVDKNIKIDYLNLERLRFGLFKLMKYFKINKPDLIFTTLTEYNVMCIIAKNLSRIKGKIVVREAINRSETDFSFFYHKIFVKLLYNFGADRIISLSEGVKNDMVQNFGVSESKVKVIYNPIEVGRISEMSIENIDDLVFDNDEKIIIAVGRLHPQKGFTDLIEAFSQISNQINAKLLILGKGEQEEELKNLIEEKQLTDKVILGGFKSNPYKYMNRADLFVLSSKYEGFGHVIVEAMATKTAVISTNCNSGPAEIITKGTGLLVPVSDIDTLAYSMLELLKDDKLRNEYAQKGYERAQGFNAKKITEEYQKVFDDIIE